jgi:TetR/AcrR family transcriptional repressor of nem operon
MTDKKMEIVEKSLALIHSQGYGNTSLRDILTAAGVGKGQFYYYFESKEELGLAILQYSFENWRQNVVQRIFHGEGSAAEKILAMLDYTVQCHAKNQAQHGCIFGNLAVELSENNEKFRLALKEVFDCWSQELAIQLEHLTWQNPLITKQDPQVLARNIVGMLEGGILLMKNQQNLEILLSMTKLIEEMLGIADVHDGGK